MTTCGKRWTCRPCTRAADRLKASAGAVVHACVLARLHRGSCSTRTKRELDVCRFDGRESVHFPDPAKLDGERIGPLHLERKAS